VCFNGGSAGDFLIALCAPQNNNMYQIDDNGCVRIHNHYFKNITEKTYKKTLTIDDLDVSKLLRVDNSHFYHKFYNNLANEIYYINYPDNLNSTIVQTYIDKRHAGNLESFFNQHIYSIPNTIRQKVNLNNAKQTFEIMWLKNLRSWQQELTLKSINFQDFFDIKKTQQLVEQLTQSSIANEELFLNTYQTWLNKNRNLQQLFL
jgi:hypothetical protein